MSSEQPRKQRKAEATAPLHRRQKRLHATLSDDLREEYNTRRTRVNTGDTVEVMRGDHAGVKGEVVNVDLVAAVAHVEDVTVEKADGEEVARPIDASNLKITAVNLDDERRQARLEGSDEE